MTTLRAVLTVLACLAIGLGAGRSAPAREVQPFNSGWRFQQGEQAEGAATVLDDNAWAEVRLPHDWAIAGPFDKAAAGDTGKLPWQGEGWYRKRFDLPEDLGDQRVLLEFDGVMAEPTVYVNGQRAGGWDYGYNSFWIDATPYVQAGQANLIAVHADTRRHTSRWYPGAGIYRKVTLHLTEPVHVGEWGLHVRTPKVEAKQSTAVVRCRIENSGAQPQDATIRLSLLGPDGEEVGSSKPQQQTVPARGSVVVEHEFKVSDAKLWSPSSPVLYAARAVVSNNEESLDERTVRIGFRKVEFTSNYGMYLNGRRLQLKGVNLHHDLGPLGVAFSKPLMRRRLQKMKEMGANAVRTSHNAPAPELLDLCDELGLLVIDELFDKWDATADLHDPSKFDSFMRRQVSNFVRRDRNHPCVVAWSIGNEIEPLLSNATPENRAKVEYVVEQFKRYDNTRPVTMGCNIVDAVAPGVRTLDALDLQSWNHGRKYARAKERYPKKPTLYSASAAALSTRGHYVLPVPQNKTEYDEEATQIGSHDLNAAPVGDIPDAEFNRMKRDQYCSGEFVWAGYDYLGEPTPFNDAWSQEVAGDFTRSARSSYFGIVDLCGLPKDRYYLYRSHWAPGKTTIHLLPHWNWSPGVKVPVFLYTNGDEAELFLNGKSLGRRKKNPQADSGSGNYYGVLDRYRLRWDGVAFEPGELKVVAYKKGKEIGTATTRTAGEARRVRLTPDCKRLRGDGVSICQVQVEVVDERGVVCPTRGDRVRFTVSGPGEIAGIGNGDPTSLESFVDAEHRVFHGKAMLTLRSLPGGSGQVQLTATAEGLKDGAIKIDVATVEDVKEE